MIVRKISVSLCCTVVIMTAALLFLAPDRSLAEQEQNQAAYYTIQIGTYISENAAERIYQRLAEQLNSSRLHDLRIEKIKDYWVVRIGRFDTKDDADMVYPVVRTRVPGAPLVTKTRVGPESVIRQDWVKESREQAAAGSQLSV